MGKKFKQLIKESKKLTLSKEEKHGIYLNLVKFIKDNPLVSKEFLPRYNYGWRFFVKSSFALRYSYAAILIVFVGGIGVSFAAQNSLPGDPLYGVKVGFNEKIIKAVITSKEAKAKYDINLAELRLKEAEILATEGRLDDEKKEYVKTLFNNHIKKTKDQLEIIKNKGKIEASAEINSELEASLKAHSGVLDKIAKIRKNHTSERVKDIALDVKAKINQTKKLRQEDEDKLFKDGAEVLESSARGKLKAVENKIEEVTKFVENKKAKINANTYDGAQIKLTLAKDKITQGKDKLDSKSFKDAFVLFQGAMRIAQEVKIYVASEENLKIKLDFPEDDSDDDDNDNSLENSRSKTRGKQMLMIK